MENYRKKLKAQNIIFSFCAAALMIILILAFSGVIKPIEGNEHWKDYWNGMIFGSSFAVMVMMIFGIIKNIIAMKNPQKLKKQFVTENDERTAQIQEKGKSSGASVFQVCMPVVMIVSGYFNITVCITCLALIFGLSVCMALGKFYYSKKI
ncbi:MAG: DUF6442 family protein [Porcipelethomonas sp.]